MGVVEQIGVKGRKAFTDCDELWEIFCPLKNVRIHKKRENTIISRDKANPWSKL